MQHDLVFGELDCPFTAQSYLSRCPHFLEAAFHLLGFNGFGLESLEAQQHGWHGAVPGAGGGKRAVQVDTDIGHVR